MSTSSWPARAFLLLSLGSAAAAAEPEPFSAFPDAAGIFRQSVADPRRIQLSADYYRLDGHDVSDVALGHSWGMARWMTNGGAWTWQWNLEAMAFSRFHLAGDVNEFQVVDFLGNLPVEARSGRFSGRAMLFHESSHLGDDYIRRTKDTGFRFSTDGLRAQASWDWTRWLRTYAGASYLLHTVPAPKRWALQAGFELLSEDLGWLKDYPVRLFAAQDFHWRERVQWNMDSRSMIGLRFGFKGTIRAMRLYLGYFDGHSPFGQFYARREHYADVGISLELF